MPITAYDLENAKKYNLTPKQALFARAYVENNGNKSCAAREAGYSTTSDAHMVRAQELVRKSKVRWAINGVLRDAVGDITPEDVLSNLAQMRDEAREAGQFSPAIKAEEMVGRHIGMWQDKGQDQGQQVTFQLVMGGKVIDGECTEIPTSEQDQAQIEQEQGE